MSHLSSSIDRRKVLAALALPLFITPGLYAEHLFPSPQLTEGPFYPDELPLDQDNDLLIINDKITPAVGEITHLSGRILSRTGEPVKDATIEIWQCDANAVYIHTSDSGSKASQQDKNFQGFGRFTTASTGQYKFRTIKPVSYPGRPGAHIHIKVKKGDRELLTTQLLIRGFAGNARDNIFGSARDLVDRELIQADWVPVKGAKVPEWTANFDIILGRTPDDTMIHRRSSVKYS